MPKYFLGLLGSITGHNCGNFRENLVEFRVENGPIQKYATFRPFFSFQIPK